MLCKGAPAIRSEFCSQEPAGVDRESQMNAGAASLSNATPLRALQKEATRQRVLAAARVLFDTHGYQGTTVRDIARDARVSVGSVFTTFASKGAILSEVMEARIEPLYAELDRVMPHVRGPTVDRLRTLF
eukprot:gene35183-58091_t